MRLAVLLENIRLTRTKDSVLHALLFEADDGLIKAVGEELLPARDGDYLCLWVLGRNVKILYCDGRDPRSLVLLGKAGIEVRPLEEIRRNPILHAMIIKYDAPDDG